MGKITSVSVFCGSAEKVDPAYHKAAARMGALLAERGIRLVYGGEKAGLLGVLSNACLAGGGAVTGIIPGFFREKGYANARVADLITVADLQDRKRAMIERADGFIVLAGGLGTLDEAFEAITTKYAGTHDKPVVFVNTANYYAPLFSTIDHMVGAGFCASSHRELYNVAATPDEALAVLGS